MSAAAMENAPEPPAVTDADEAPQQALLNHVDIVVVVVYFLMVMATGIYVRIGGDGRWTSWVGFTQ